MSYDLNPKIKIQITEIAKKYYIDKIILFGSRAKGNNNKKSDIDIAVYATPDFKYKGHFICDLEDIDTLLKIDIVFIDTATDEKLVQNIENEGIILYERLQAEI